MGEKNECLGLPSHPSQKHPGDSPCSAHLSRMISDCRPNIKALPLSFSLHMAHSNPNLEITLNMPSASQGSPMVALLLVPPGTNRVVSTIARVVIMVLILVCRSQSIYTQPVKPTAEAWWPPC